MGVSEIGFPQNVVYKNRIQTSDTLPVTIGASKYCEFLFDIDAGDRMTPLGIVGWGCDDKTQVFLLDFYMDNDLQTAKLILKNPYATTIAINSLYIDVLYSKQGLDMSEVDVVDNLTTDSAVAALSARQGKILNEKIITPVVYKGTFSTTTVPSGVGTIVSSLTLPAGTYIMNASVQFTQSFAELTILMFTGPLDANGIVRSTGAGGGGMNISHIQTFTSTSTVGVIVYHSNASPQVINQTSFNAIKIL